nr:acetyl-CoA synthetase [Chthoniobacterales bacterium]
MEKDIESHLKETRVFKPSRAFAKNARIGSLDQYRRMYRESIRQ